MPPLPDAYAPALAAGAALPDDLARGLLPSTAAAGRIQMKISGARRSLACAFACWAGTAVEAVAGSPVHVQVVDDATGVRAIQFLTPPRTGHGHGLGATSVGNLCVQESDTRS